MTPTLEPVLPPQSYGTPEGDAAALASILAHRLRSVVASIQTCAELLADTLTDADRPLALHILEGTAAIEQTVTDLLYYSHRPEPVLFPLSVLALVNQTIEGMAFAPDRLALEHALSADDRLLADPVLFRQSLVILLQNALEASPPSTPIHVCLTRELGWYKISINNECGVCQDQLTAFMNPFVTTKPDRLGLGLTIARRALESMGGALNARATTDLNSVTLEVIMPSA